MKKSGWMLLLKFTIFIHNKIIRHIFILSDYQNLIIILFFDTAQSKCEQQQKSFNELLFLILRSKDKE